MRHLSITAIAACCFATMISAQIGHAEVANGGAPGDWLARYASTRSVGLGGAFVATPDEPLGAVWNPAGLSLLFQNEGNVETARLFEGTSLYSLSFAVPSQKLPSVALTMISLNSGDFERTSELNEPMGSFSEGDLAVLLSASKSLNPQLAVGASIKMVRQTVEEFGATGLGGDLGVIYQPTETIRLGASFLNLGGPSLTLRDTEESYPGQLRGGFSVLLFHGKGLISAEMDHRSGSNASLHAGTEYWLYPQVGIRLGLSDGEPGGGFSYRFPTGLEFRYALTDEELGMTHRIGLSYRFGGFYANSQADPTVFSPLGSESVTKFQMQARTKSVSKDWSLEITDKSGHVARRFGGKGAPPAHVMWDGKDEVGLPLPDGSYTYVLSVRDEQGREITSRERIVEITTEGPQGAVPVVVR